MVRIKLRSIEEIQAYPGENLDNIVKPRMGRADNKRIIRDLWLDIIVEVEGLKSLKMC